MRLWLTPSAALRLLSPAGFVAVAAGCAQVVGLVSAALSWVTTWSAVVAWVVHPGSLRAQSPPSLAITASRLRCQSQPEVP